ncbi:GTPase-activator protein for Ras family GTPase [Entamoeba nuttalli P19]|uniref:GTPase-activator protein for Ras family GTPase n=1 Tax=Entamoeba nuttalli (strain P19) TaxID=1076696 RepID=K2HTN7_ENTNP|nr:GTPase-activator protein for Ras family GTPase [Entamoeba nuttalli P19]EKE39500.1 GTPase-activator protein for Ras family GTPase [Entamoeba nuttalli P19]|eukprot:XP_008858164.1 GTPase-activator protein for Ras family GTPase [Entamoeba nuttalli P19]
MSYEYITFEEALFSTDVDILTGVLKFFCEKGKSEQETENKLKMFFKFFSGSNRMIDLLEWVIKKEMKETQSVKLMFKRESVYNTIIRIYMEYDIKQLLVSLTESIIILINKNKIYINLMDISQKVTTKELKKLKELMKYFIKKLLLIDFPSSFISFISEIATELTEYFPGETTNVLTDLLLKRFLCSVLVTTIPKENKELVCMTLQSISLIFKWVLDGQYDVDCLWKKEFKRFAQTRSLLISNWLINLFTTNGMKSSDTSLEETEVDENMTVGELRQHMAALYFANPEEIKLSEKKGNSYYKELKYDMLTLKSLDFTPQSLVLVESTKGKSLVFNNIY